MSSLTSFSIEIPNNIKRILGNKECSEAAISFFKIFQDENLNMDLLIDIFEALLEVLWDDVDWKSFKDVL